MHRRLLSLILFSLLLTSCFPQRATPVATPAIALTDCILPTEIAQQVDARCGTLNVPEDYSKPAGRQIALNIALVPAIKRNPLPDPLFLLAGGPGQSAVEAYPSLVLYLNSVHKDRDILLVDQRGTGKSNPLRCLDSEEQETLSDAQAITRLQSCPERLDADLRFYTTEIAMQDLDAVRAALGYETINLYGASYGTRAALTYLRMFPQRVRTATLDAVVDPGYVLFQDASRDGQAALDRFFSRCAADESCRTAFPDLQAEFLGLLDRLEASPVEITLLHPVTGKPLTLTVTRKMVTGMVFNILYSPDLVAMLPLALHSASTDGNYLPMVSMSYLMDSDLYDGIFYAVTCTEDAPLLSPSEMEKMSQGTVFGNRAIDFTQVCAKWPKGSVSAAFRSPIQSNVPVLILSGEVDPITPPVHAEKVADTLGNELHLVFKGMGHTNMANQCVTRVFQEFLDSASTAGLDTSCIAGIKPPPFFVNFSGPRP